MAKMSAKVQKISPKLQKESTDFANIITLEAEEEEAEEKGSIYTLISLRSKTPLDTELVTRLATDTLRSTYYQSDSTSLVQALEKSVLDVKERLVKMGTGVEFSFIGGVFWENILYLVKYNIGGQVFITRDGNTKDIEFTAEGSFATASGIIKEEDVIIMGSAAFTQKFPPKKLFKATTTTFKNLAEKESCLMLKMVPDETTPKTQKKPPPKLPKLNIALGKKVLLPVLGILLLISLYKTATSKKDAPKNVKGIAHQETAKNSTESPTEATNAQEKDTQAEYKKTDTFYDLKITDMQTTPSEITVLDNIIVVADKTNGTLYTSEVNIPKFTKTDGFTGIHSLTTLDTNIGFVDNTGYKIYDPQTNSLVKKYEMPNMGLTAAYLDFLYEITNDKITKYTRENTLEGSLWGQSADLENAKSISIAVSIYVLKSNGEIVKYTSGQKNEFEITELPAPLKTPIQILTDLNWNHIYIADQSDRSIVIINKDGTFVRKLRPENSENWANIKGFGITSDETKAFILNESKIYEITL